MTSLSPFNVTVYSVNNKEVTSISYVDPSEAKYQQSETNKTVGICLQFHSFDFFQQYLGFHSHFAIQKEIALI